MNRHYRLHIFRRGRGHVLAVQLGGVFAHHGEKELLFRGVDPVCFVCGVAVGCRGSGRCARRDGLFPVRGERRCLCRLVSRDGRYFPLIRQPGEE
jgi:hypothetical protein